MKASRNRNGVKLTELQEGLAVSGISSIHLQQHDS